MSSNQAARVVFFGFLLSWVMPFIIWWQYGTGAAALAWIGMAAGTAAGKAVPIMRAGKNRRGTVQ